MVGRVTRPKSGTADTTQLTLPRSTETFGQRLRRLRIEQNKSQRDLSGPGVSHAYISRLEAGVRTPSMKAIRVLARSLGVTPGFLETGADLTVAEELELRLAHARLRVKFGQAGDAAARDTFVGLLADARTAAESELAAEAQLMVGVAALAAGDPESAISNLEEALGSPLISPSLHAHAYVALADAYCAVHQSRTAIELLESAIGELDELGFDDPVARAQLTGCLHHALEEIGDSARAREVATQARLAASADRDLRARVRLWWSLGQVAAAEGRPHTALRALQRAVSALPVLEETEHTRSHLRPAEPVLHSDRANPTQDRTQRQQSDEPLEPVAPGRS